MAQIIKEPGKDTYAIFSNVVDAFTHEDMTREDIIQERLADAEEKIRAEVNKICDKIDKGEPAYHQFTMTYEKAKAKSDETERNNPKVYSVFAIYEDSNQRYADVVMAMNPEEAEQLATEHAESPIIVSAVVLGNIPALDTDTNNSNL